jgi:hypothetical protein
MLASAATRQDARGLLEATGAARRPACDCSLSCGDCLATDSHARDGHILDAMIAEAIAGGRAMT